MSAGSSIETKAETRRRPRLGEHWQAMPLEDLAWIEGLALHWPALQRSRWALWLNIVVPGAGLLALQRESKGLPLAGIFLVFAEVALLGLFIMPRTLGMVVTATAVGVAALDWLAAQILLLGRIHELQDAQRQFQAAARIEQAREAVLASKWASAKQLLDEAAEYDQEQPELNWLLAKVYSAVARWDQATGQWRRLRQVDRAGRYDRDVRDALSSGPQKI